MRRLLALILVFTSLFSVLPAGAAEATEAPTITGVRADRSTMTAGESLTWTVGVSGGHAPYRYHYRLIKNGVEYKKIGWVDTSLRDSTLSQPGEWQMQALVEDANGQRSDYVLSAKVRVSEAEKPAREEPLKLERVEADASVITEGGELRFSAVVSGGRTPYRYHYRLMKDGSEYKKIGWLDEGSRASVLNLAGVYRMQMLVEDSKGERSDYVLSPEVTVKALAPLKIERVEADASFITEGGELRFSAVVSGGRTPYRYHYRLMKDGSEYKKIGWLDEGSRTSVLSQAGVYRMQMLVEDSKGERSDYVLSPEVTVEAPTPLKIERVEADASVITEGGELRFSAVVSGGRTPYRYHYRLMKDGSEYKKIGWLDEGSRTSVLNQAGVYRMQMLVEDSKGERSNYAFSPDVTVEPAPEEELFSEGYAFVLADEALVQERARSASAELTRLSRGDVVYVSRREPAGLPGLDGDDWLLAHFDTSWGVATGYIRADRLAPCMPEETCELLEAISRAGTDGCYENHPLPRLDCVINEGYQPESEPERESDLTQRTVTLPGYEKYDYLSQVFDGGAFPETMEASDREGVVWRGYTGSSFPSDPQIALSSIHDLDVVYSACNKPLLIMNESATWTIVAAGGSGSYTYAFTAYWGTYGSGKNFSGFTRVGQQGFSANNTFTLNINRAGVYQLQIYVRDSQGRSLVWWTIMQQTAYRSDENKPNTVIGKVNQLAAQCRNAASTDYARAKWFHDWLCANAYYVNEDSISYMAEGVLLRGRGVCQSYAIAYQLLLDRVGIPNIMVWGDDTDTWDDVSHAWNLVKIGPVWYHVDVTWDDGSGLYGGYSYNYFLKSDSTMWRDHRWPHYEDKYPACPYNYGETITWPRLERVTASTTSMRAGQSVTFEAQVSGGKAPYKYHYRLIRDGAEYKKIGWIKSANRASTLNFDGEWQMQMLVEDAAGLRSEYVLSPKVQVRSLMLSGVHSSRIHLVPGMEVTFSAVGVSGGTPPYQYHYRLIRNGAEYKKIGWTASSSRTSVLNYTGVWQMQMLVKDSAGRLSEYMLSDKVTVGYVAKPVLSSVTASKTTMTAGQSVTFTAVVSSGTGPFRYHYRLIKDGADYKKIGWIENASRMSILNHAGVWRMQMLVEDAYGQRSDYVLSPPVTVTLGAPLLSSVQISKTAITSGQSVTFTAVVSGGQAPYQYHYELWKDGDIYKTIGWSSTASRTSTLHQPGMYSMRMRVKDSNSQYSSYVNSSTVTVGIAAPPLEMGSWGYWNNSSYYISFNPEVKNVSTNKTVNRFKMVYYCEDHNIDAIFNYSTGSYYQYVDYSVTVAPGASVYPGYRELTGFTSSDVWFVNAAIFEVYTTDGAKFTIPESQWEWYWWYVK